MGRWIDTIEVVRRQVEDRAGTPEPQPVRAGLIEFEHRLITFEEQLYQLRLTGGQDGMRWGGQLLEKLSHLASGPEESDSGPTAQQHAVQDQFAAEIGRLHPEFESLTTRGLAELNALLTNHGQLPITLTLKAR